MNSQTEWLAISRAKNPFQVTFMMWVNFATQITILFGICETFIPPRHTCTIIFKWSTCHAGTQKKKKNGKKRIKSGAWHFCGRTKNMFCFTNVQTIRPFDENWIFILYSEPICIFECICSRTMGHGISPPTEPHVNIYNNELVEL